MTGHRTAHRTFRSTYNLSRGRAVCRSMPITHQHHIDHRPPPRRSESHHAAKHQYPICISITPAHATGIASCLSALWGPATSEFNARRPRRLKVIACCVLVRPSPHRTRLDAFLMLPTAPTRPPATTIVARQLPPGMGVVALSLGGAQSSAGT